MAKWLSGSTRRWPTIFRFVTTWLNSGSLTRLEDLLTIDTGLAASGTSSQLELSLWNISATGRHSRPSYDVVLTDATITCGVTTTSGATVAWASFVSAPGVKLFSVSSRIDWSLAWQTRVMWNRNFTQSSATLWLILMTKTVKLAGQRLDKPLTANNQMELEDFQSKIYFYIRAGNICKCYFKDFSVD